MNVKELFRIRPTNEEQNDFIITVGQHLATEQHFESKKEANNRIGKKIENNITHVLQMDIRNRTPTKWRNKNNRVPRIFNIYCKMGKENSKIRLGNHNPKKGIYIIITIHYKKRL